MFDLAAKLIEHNYISVLELYPHLRPTDEEARASQNKMFEDVKAEAKSIRYSLVDKEVKSPASDRVKNFRETTNKEVKESQKFGLLEALTENDDWENAFLLIRKMGHYCPGVGTNIARAMCKRIHSLLEPIYRPYVIFEFQFS